MADLLEEVFAIGRVIGGRVGEGRFDCGPFRISGYQDRKFQMIVSAHLRQDSPGIQVIKRLRLGRLHEVAVNLAV